MSDIKQILAIADAGGMAAGGRRFGLSPATVSAPLDFGRNRLSAMIDSFLADHREVTFDLRLSDGLVDPVTTDVDCSPRFSVPRDSSLIQRRLAR